jgi:hypothetical protein
VKYLFYKTTCLVTDKFYYGVHLERRKNDGYIGCGVKSKSTAISLKKSGVKSAFIDSVIKYGYYNFKRETIAEYDTATEAYLHEAKVVTRELIADPMCLNLKLGGYYGKTERLSRPISIINVLNGQVLDFDSHTSCNAFLEQDQHHNNTKGWIWEQKCDAWASQLENWKRQYNKLGRLPSKCATADEDEQNAANWRAVQSSVYKRKKMINERIKILESTPGWKWAGKELSCTT